MISSTLAVCLLSLLLALPAAASSFVDPLDAPAEPSPLSANAQLLAIARAGDRLVTAGMRGHVLYSDDDGLTWTQAKVPVSVTLTAVYFPTPQQGWAAGTVTIDNQCPYFVQLRINGQMKSVGPGRFDFPVWVDKTQEIAVIELVGYQPPRNWKLSAPDYAAIFQGSAGTAPPRARRACR